MDASTSAVLDWQTWRDPSKEMKKRGKREKQKRGAPTQRRNATQRQANPGGADEGGETSKNAIAQATLMMPG